MTQKSLKFLGITFDYAFTFEEHVNNVRKKSFASMNILKYLCGTWWGTNPSTLLILYKSYIRSLMDYGIFIYTQKNSKNLEKIEKIQNVALRICMGYRQSTYKYYDRRVQSM